MVRPRNNTGLMIGAVAVGIAIIFAFIAFVANPEDEKKPTRKTRKTREKVETIDVTPKASPAPSRIKNREKEFRPLKRAARKPGKPDSYYRQFVDFKIWEEAKGHADKANRMLRNLKKGIIPQGMTESSVKKKARELLCLATEKGSQFMSPLDDRREEAEHFIALYEDVMMAWMRKSRALLFNSKK